MGFTENYWITHSAILYYRVLKKNINVNDLPSQLNLFRVFDQLYPWLPGFYRVGIKLHLLLPSFTELQTI